MVIKQDVSIIQKAIKYVYIGKNFRPSKELSWNIVISVPESKILEGVNNTFFETLIISFIILILFLLIALKISSRFI